MKYIFLTTLLFITTLTAYAGEERLTGNQPLPGTNPGLLAIVPTSDPGFEAGTPNPFWTESSTNFGTPICDGNSCGLGGGTGPHSGNFWAWFGGISAFEESSLSQMITLPKSESATLSFFIEIPACNDVGFLEVLINGNQIYSIDQTDPICGAIGYNKIVLDISAYSNQVFTLSFHAVTQGTGSGAINIFVDDISLNNTVKIPTLSVLSKLILLLTLVLLTVFIKNTIQPRND